MAGSRTFAFPMGLVLACCGGRVGNDDFTSVVPACVPGQQLACACPAGTSSVQVCRTDGTFGRCACEIPVTSGGASGSSTEGGRLGISGGMGGGEVPASKGGSGGLGSGGVPGKAGATSTGGGGVVLASGEDKLIEVFPADTGLLVITANAVQLLDRSGTEVSRLPSPREITAAAFDGTTLVVADKARFVSYDPELNELASGDLAEACVAGVLLSGSRFVCGPSNDWDRVYYTYDALSGMLLASSKKYTYNGIPMRRVPGTDDFVTVTVDSSPSDFHLYTLLNDEASFVNESPYHGDFRVTNTYTFDASPPNHLITDSGLLLRLYGSDCSTKTNSFTSGCFVKDGSLGTLSGSQVFVGMDSDGGGTVFGLVDPNDSFSSAVCAKSCIAQRIDVASRTVTSQKLHTLAAGRIIATRHDSIADKLVVGYMKATDRYYVPSDPYPGYGVTLLDYR